MRLAWSAALDDAPTAVVVQLGGSGVGVGGGGGGLELLAVNGGAAEAQWREDEAARRAYDPARLASECAPNATLLGWAANASGFATRMGAVGLGGRFEALQAEAVLRALNVSAARCEGRRDGSIAPLPAEPAAWAKYGVLYNQSRVEAYFDDLVGRIWRGLITAIRAYDRGNASPVQRQVLRIFRGQGGGGGAATHAVQEEAAALDRRIEEAEVALERLRVQRARLEL